MRIRGRLPGRPDVVDVVIEGARIASVEPASDSPADHGDAGCVVSSAHADLQVNGYGGVDLNCRVWSGQVSTPDAVHAVAHSLAEHGTGLFCPTLVTNSPEDILLAARAVATACDADPGLAEQVLGIHLEGPFLSPVEGPRGAHMLEFIRDPDWDLFQQFQEAAGGRIRILTLAPERPGALAVIRKAADSGVVVSIGHSDAQPEDVHAAIDAGASISTHLGNGSHALLPRLRNYVWEQLAADELTVGVIGDLHHVPAAVLKSFARIKGPERIYTVSDAVMLGGMRPGIYHNGRHEVLPSGRVNLAGTPFLAGAGHLLDTCVANLQRATDLGEDGALATVTRIPARILGLQSVTGQLRAGLRGDVTCFRWTTTGPIEVVATVVGGRVLHREP
ncbi:MAG: N-acetylglucosamine-6-phosphate deacetylase [Armatimonadetes bacterium]|nr:N-acetylglucosamine-6-phosphate deacetylase [Armatimonadota bacterium]